MSAIPPASVRFIPFAKPVRDERSSSARSSEKDVRPSRWEWTYGGWEPARSDDDFTLG
jgi:hypothetical protein